MSEAENIVGIFAVLGVGVVVALGMITPLLIILCFPRRPPANSGDETPPPSTEQTDKSPSQKAST